jgi:hypothetical protein
MFGAVYFGQDSFGALPVVEVSSSHGFVPIGSGTYTLMTVKNSAGELTNAVTSKATPYVPSNNSEEEVIAKTWSFLIEKI